MIKKILKWTGLILVLLITGVSITTYSRQHLHYDAPYPNIKASTDSHMIALGRNIVLGSGHCVDCHSKTKNVDSVLRLGQDPVLSAAINSICLSVLFTPATLHPTVLPGLAA
jgi:hypothetical protein